MRCWRRMEKISWTNHMKNEDVSHRVNEERNILHTIKWSQANQNGHILHRNYLLKHAIEGKIEEMGRWDRRLRQLLADLKEERGDWNMKEEAYDHAPWRTCFERFLNRA
jgi:hypothetical protein